MKPVKIHVCQRCINETKAMFRNFNSMLLLWFTAFNSCTRNTNSAKEVPVYSINGILGDELRLPCDISMADDPIINKQEDDSIVLVLWYREDQGVPIFSIDARERSFETAEKWFDHSLKGRAYFTTDTEPSNLVIRQAREDDSGLYRCRVDFKLAQIRNSRINVTVIVPPKKILVLDENEVPKQTVVGPYAENSIIVLRCIVYGGKPAPNIVWYKNKEIINNSTGSSRTKSKLADQEQERNNNGAKEEYRESVITLKNLRRTDLHSELICMASNNDKRPPLSVILHLDMNFAPLNVVIGDHGQPLTVQRRYELVCQSFGSRPPAKITWWKDGKRLEKSRDTTSSDGNVTTSTIIIVPTEQDNGKYLSCLAENPILGKQLETGWNLRIHSVPQSKIVLGTSLKADSIKEGMDIYFDCIISSFPAVYRIEWRKNNETLHHNSSSSIIISNRSLVLQRVTRASTGNYTCTGYNTEGHGDSNIFFLNVMYAPTCKSNQTKVYGAAKREQVNVSCEVEANPSNDISFVWMFNNSADSIDVSKHLTYTDRTISVISHQPILDTDYGTLLCLAKNKIGQQHTPCIFHVIAAGKPDSVSNCSVNNTSFSNFVIHCAEGFNGGIPQTFLMQIRKEMNQVHVSNITSTVPFFSISTLEAATRYTISIYSINKKGHSEPYVIDIVTEGESSLQRRNKITEKPPEKQSHNFHISTAFSIVSGCVISFVFICCTTMIILRSHCFSKSGCDNGRHSDKKLSNNSDSNSNSKKNSSSSYKDEYIDCSSLEGVGVPTIMVTPVSNTSDEEKNPDLIPHLSIGECGNVNSVLGSNDNCSTSGSCDYYGKRRYISIIGANNSDSVQNVTVPCINSGYFTFTDVVTEESVPPPPPHRQHSISKITTSSSCSSSIYC